MLLTISVTVRTEDDLDDFMGLLESQIAEALGFVGDVQTCDISVEDEDFDDENEDLESEDDDG